MERVGLPLACVSRRENNSIADKAACNRGERRPFINADGLLSWFDVQHLFFKEFIIVIIVFFLAGFI